MFKRKKLIIGLSVLVAGLSLLANFISGKFVVPILMYHAINDKPVAGRMLTVTVNTFERQMRFLKTHHYNVVALEALADLIAGKKPIPQKTVALTFDDGYKDNFTNAFPVLKKYGLPATMFIIINEVGRAQADRLSWDEIKAMQSSGVISFGSHTIGPDPLTKMKSEDELRSQVFDSKRILEEKLGSKVGLFSYPEGTFNAHIKQLVRDAGYKLAVATNPGKTSSNTDLFAIKRIRISENSRNIFIFWIETSGYYTFMKEHRHR